jgi:two-component system NtrC family sensor kinase
VILAVSRFRVLDGREGAIREAFAGRPHLVDGERGFLGMEVFTNRKDPALFYLVTRWTDPGSFQDWHAGPRHHASHQGMPRPLRLDPAFTELLELERIAEHGPALNSIVADEAPLLARFLDGSLAVGVLVVGIDGSVQACNRAVADFLKLPAAELVGTSLWDRLAADDQVSLRARVERGERPREPFLLNFVDAAGSVLTLECHLDVWPAGFLLVGEAPSQRDAGIPEEMMQLNNELASLQRESARQRNALDRALKELQRAQAQLVHQEKMASLGQMTAGIAHEINNPLAYVHGNQVALRRDFDDLMAFVNAVGDALPAIQGLLPQVHEALLRKAEEVELSYLAESVPRKLAAAIEGTDRVTQIVLDLRSFTRLDEASRKDVDLAEGVQATLRFLGNVARERAVELVTRFEAIPPTPCAPGPLQQAISNVILNAIQASPPRGTVSVAVRGEGGVHLVEVEDQGAGIAPEHLAKIFDPFFTTKPVGEGTGLGLTIAHQVVNAHGGSIDVATPPGGGTRVTIRLPVADPPNGGA